MKRNERRDMSDTMKDVLRYLRERLGESSAYVSYGTIAKEVGKSRHAVAFAVERLKGEGKLRVYDGELMVVGE
ncbi:MAG: hypothetical protein IJV83_00020 [Clostridia bacterium]|nr:hypothetical protein [Clostridia bacterium]